MSSDSTIRKQYAEFLTTDAGKDFVKQAQVIQSAELVKAMHQDATAEQKALSVARIEGTIRLRDYVINQTKAPNKASTPYKRQKG